MLCSNHHVSVMMLGIASVLFVKLFTLLLVCFVCDVCQLFDEVQSVL